MDPRNRARLRLVNLGASCEDRMQPLVPINLGYVQDRYRMPESSLRFFLDYVLPSMLARYSLDERVEKVEVISDADLGHLEFISSKVICTNSLIPKELDANGVAAHIIEARKTQSKVVVQCNPLFPFISIDSLYFGYQAVASGEVCSAVGSIVHKSCVTVNLLASEHDLGIFSVYDTETFMSTGQRVSPPFSEIGLQAVELIGLRNPKDMDLFELVVNSGFSL